MADCTELQILDKVLDLLEADAYTTAEFETFARSAPAVLASTRLPAVCVEFGPDGIEPGLPPLEADVLRCHFDIFVVASDAESEEARDACMNLAKLVYKALNRTTNRRGSPHNLWRLAGFGLPKFAGGYVPSDEGRRVRVAIVKYWCEYTETLEG